MHVNKKEKSWAACWVSLLLSTPSLGQVLPDDPDFPLQWGLFNSGQLVDGKSGTPGADIHGPQVWALHHETAPVIVAVVGTGVNPHPEYASRLLDGHATTGDPFDTLDIQGVGSFTAGIIGAARGNALGIAGVYSTVRLLPVRVVDQLPGSANSLARGIEWAVDQGAGVVFVMMRYSSGTQALSDAIDYANARDVLVIAPAGNTGSDEVGFPAGYAGCMAISATTNADGLADFSSFGAEVELSAPGESIWSTWSDGGYGTRSSSSSAAALVAGVAALVGSYAPQLSASQVREILLASADDLGTLGPDIQFGAGRLNAQAAVALAPPPAIRFEAPDPLPTERPPGEATQIIIQIANGDETVTSGSPTLYYRGSSEQFTPQAMASVGDDSYLATLPPAPCEATLEYYFRAQGDAGTVVTDPFGAPQNVYTIRAIDQEFIFDDGFEQDLGWEVVSEGGEETRGLWTRVVPVGTTAQPEFDYSRNEGRTCYVTGQFLGGSANTSDVDGGPVRLISPIISVLAPDVEVSYARWFYWSGEGETDVLTVELSRDGGGSWMVVESVTNTAMSWQPRSFRLSDFPEITGRELRMRFTIADPVDDDSLVEAGVDEFHVRAIHCLSTAGDFDGDGFSSFSS